MDSPRIYITSKTSLGNLENFLESARGKDIVVEDKDRKSNGSIRLGVREEKASSSTRAKDIAQTRQALYQVISARLTENNMVDALFFLQSQVKPGGNCDALFLENTSQLKPEALDKLFQSKLVDACSPPVYRSRHAIHVGDAVLLPGKYLSMPTATKNLPTPKHLADKARKGELLKDPSNTQFASIFVNDFERMAKSGAYRLESPDGRITTCKTLEQFANFVGPGDQTHFANGANLVTVVSYLTSQTLPIFLNAAILKSSNTPITSPNGSPLFFKANLNSTYDLKKMADGGIMLAYKGECRPDQLRISPEHNARFVPLRKPGSVKVECAITFRPNGDIEYGNVHIHTEGLHL